TAILIAVLLVALVTAGNNYSKELQFRSLEKSSQQDERCSVVRSGTIERLNPTELVVGDILILQAGDAIPADCIILDEGVVCSNESALTGEAEDLPKCRDKDCIGESSQWGKIKANLVTESVNTPLQIGYIGTAAAAGTFIAMVASIWLRHHGKDVLDGFVEAFIIAVTIIVVAIPEGLPLAVTISLAYSTKKMYEDQNFIRVLAACETMGNATNLCSDKTGTLTENRMTVVEAWMADKKYSQVEFDNCAADRTIKEIVSENCCINRVAYLIHVDANGNRLPRPNIIGNKTEGALILMAKGWGFDYEDVKRRLFDESRDKVFSFNSAKKRSTAVVHRADGSVRLYVKGAPEWILTDCTSFLLRDGTVANMTQTKKKEIEDHINAMANNARRTLCLAHKDFKSASLLPPNWQQSPPDNS
ncbi:ACA6, partial [Symbiodinium microadriaticum]